MGALSLNIITFPLWWYTTGLGLVWHFAVQKFQFWMRKSGMAIFTKHIGEPLYGDYTKGGRVISFFIRLFLLFFKSIFLIIKLALLLLLILGYCLLLPLVLIMVLYEVFPV